jgi:hypothetical protein
MAANDFSSDPGGGLRTGVTPQQLARAARESSEQRERIQREIALTAGVGFVLACAGAFWLYRRRAQVLSSADNIALGAAASGLKAKRKIDSTLRRFADRVRERADEGLM